MILIALFSLGVYDKRANDEKEVKRPLMNLGDKSIFSGKTLDYFFQLTETMNYTQAAQKLGISQPALTQRIKKFEQAIGTPLFYFKGKEMCLTEAGESMIRATKYVQCIFKHTLDEINSIENEELGHLKIGALPSIGDEIFVEFLAYHHENNPQSKVSLSIVPREEIWEKLENNQLDIGIVCLPDKIVKNWNRYASKIIAEEELFFIHKEYAKRNKPTIRLKETLQNKWVFYPNKFYINDTLKAHFIYQNLDLPVVSGYFSSPRQLQLFNQQSGHYTALPKSYIDANPLAKNQYMLPFDPPITYQLAFVFKKETIQVDRMKNFFFYFDKFSQEKESASRLKS